MSHVLTLVSPDRAAVEEAVRRIGGEAQWLGEAAADLVLDIARESVTEALGDLPVDFALQAALAEFYPAPIALPASGASTPLAPGLLSTGSACHWISFKVAGRYQS